jgi:hypothetical protein
MAAGIEEFSEMLAGLAKHAGIGDAEAVEAERSRLACERGFDVGRRKFCRYAQKSRST